MQNFAPIALFVYNRPVHTQRVIEALQKNVHAELSDLYIFSDGARSGDEDVVNEVRDLVKKTEGFKSVTVVERPSNYGLAKSVISGVTQLNKEYGHVIVFEDDVVSSPYSLKYFNDALEKYKDTPKVMHIGAFMYAIDTKGLPETFFVRHISSQCWATWDRAWQYFEPDIDKIIQQFDEKKKFAFQLDGAMNFWKHVMEFKHGKNNSWAIRWYASVFLKGGLGLQTSVSMVDNIGHDGSGVHSEKSNIYAVTVKPDPVASFPDKIEEHPEAYQALRYFLKHRKGNLVQRGIRYLRNHILKV
ncbi:glycosyltransferase family 2 protein [Pedobacter hiemivivus]|uniref:Glycosyltransferase family 2 protein n=1 Tax=Pedobacter hiemivivus TaxID=2530454 RepID=A0A4U1G086_9SPHI|nr:glycosyltransferase [Pedobacter hiemivivus]TKC56875.1 glycosyltransferase family 2 protein [Pedobacter hiemivivus]